MIRVNEDLETIIREVYSCYDVKYGNAIVDLQQRIDKAIEYIEKKNWIEYSDFQYVDNDDELNIDCESIKELLDILKGSDKDED